jgi:hypothetical protein
VTRAFTLLEVTVIGTIILVCFGIVLAAAHSSERAQRKADDRLMWAQGTNLLFEQIEQDLVLCAATAPHDVRPALDAAASDWTIPIIRGGERRWVTYRLDEASATLSREEHSADAHPASPRVLLSSVRSARFQITNGRVVLHLVPVREPAHAVTFVGRMESLSTALQCPELVHRPNA